MNLNDTDNNKDLHCSFLPVEGTTDTMIIEPRGIINTYNVVPFKEQLDLLVKRGYINLVFDLTDIDYISAVGVGLFIQLLSKTRKSGGDIILTNLQNSVIDVFNLPGFSGFFTISSDIESALNGFSKDV